MLREPAVVLIHMRYGTSSFSGSGHELTGMPNMLFAIVIQYGVV